MTKKISETDIRSEMIDSDAAVISVRGENFVLDYSALMDFLTNLATVAARMEHEFESGVQTPTADSRNLKMPTPGRSLKVVS